MKVVLIEKEMFGDDGPTYGDIGEAVSFLLEAGTVFLDVKFDNYDGLWMVPVESLLPPGVHSSMRPTWDDALAKWSISEMQNIFKSKGLIMEA